MMFDISPSMLRDLPRGKEIKAVDVRRIEDNHVVTCRLDQLGGILEDLAKL